MIYYLFCCNHFMNYFFVIIMLLLLFLLHVVVDVIGYQKLSVISLYSNLNHKGEYCQEKQACLQWTHSIQKLMFLRLNTVWNKKSKNTRISSILVMIWAACFGVYLQYSTVFFFRTFFSILAFIIVLGTVYDVLFIQKLHVSKEPEYEKGGEDTAPLLGETNERQEVTYKTYNGTAASTDNKNIQSPEDIGTVTTTLGTVHVHYCRFRQLAEPAMLSKVFSRKKCIVFTKMLIIKWCSLSASLEDVLLQTLLKVRYWLQLGFAVFNDGNFKTCLPDLEYLFMWLDCKIYLRDWSSVKPAVVNMQW